jgi:hypothetical protein
MTEVIPAPVLKAHLRTTIQTLLERGSHAARERPHHRCGPQDHPRLPVSGKLLGGGHRLRGPAGANSPTLATGSERCAHSGCRWRMRLGLRAQGAVGVGKLPGVASGSATPGVKLLHPGHRPRALCPQSVPMVDAPRPVSPTATGSRHRWGWVATQWRSTRIWWICTGLAQRIQLGQALHRAGSRGESVARRSCKAVSSRRGNGARASCLDSA